MNQNQADLGIPIDSERSKTALMNVMKNGECNITDGCYDIKKQEKSKLYIVCRTNGRNGVEGEICMSKQGKWASGCGFSDMFAFHYGSADKAAREYCD